jgi:hypothetical protein
VFHITSIIINQVAIMKPFIVHICQFLTSSFSNDVTMCSFPFRVTSTVKHRISGRDQEQRH